jgi:hypothetical protein
MFARLTYAETTFGLPTVRLPARKRPGPASVEGHPSCSRYPARAHPQNRQMLSLLSSPSSDSRSLVASGASG